MKDCVVPRWRKIHVVGGIGSFGLGSEVSSITVQLE